MLNKAVLVIVILYTFTIQCNDINAKEWEIIDKNECELVKGTGGTLQCSDEEDCDIAVDESCIHYWFLGIDWCEGAKRVPYKVNACDQLTMPITRCSISWTPCSKVKECFWDPLLNDGNGGCKWPDWIEGSGSWLHCNSA